MLRVIVKRSGLLYDTWALEKQTNKQKQKQLIIIVVVIIFVVAVVVVGVLKESKIHLQLPFPSFVKPGENTRNSD